MIYKMLRGGNGTFYLPESFLRLAGTVFSSLEAASGKSLPFNNETVSRLFDEYRFSSAPFCGDYNWKPPYTPEEGISETVKWFLSDNR
jgi:nucleoside-diphosphate-sugar epimerase